MLRRFLQEVSAESPSSFRFVATRGTESKRPYHVACDTLDNVLQAIGRRGNDRRDVWFTTACFNVNFIDRILDDGTTKRITGRHVEYAVAAKALFCDVDIKNDDAHYHDIPSALKALQEFCGAAKIPLPTWVVATGGGLHLWWALTESLAADRWRPLAVRFKNCMASNKFLADLGCTQDMARLMRVPTTHNMKIPETPRRIEAARCSELIDALVLEQAFAGYDGQLPTRPSRANIDAKVAEAAKILGIGFENPIAKPDFDPAGNAPLGEGVQLGNKPVNFHTAVSRCLVLQHVLATGGAGLSEEAWKNTLHCATFAADDGMKYAHEMSKGHASYSPAVTEQKYSDRVMAKNSGIGPITCRTFEKSELGQHCALCPYRGMVASPVQFGRDNFHLLSSRPEWDLSPDGKALKNVVDANGNVSWQERFYGYRFLSHSLVNTEDGELHLALDIELRGRTTQHKVNVKNMADLRSFKRSASPFMSGPDAILTDLLGYSEGWVQELRNSVRHVEDFGRLGWIDRGTTKGLCIGDVTLWETGAVEPLTPHGLLSQYGTRGRVNAIEDALRLVLQGPPQLWVPIAAAYAGPVCELTQQQGAVVSMLGLTGAGKSSAIKTGAAVWGHPTKSICVMTDTANSAIKRLGSACHLPVFWDEAAVTADAAGFANLVFQIVTGRGKARLNSSAEMLPVDGFCTVFVVGTNDRLRERIAGLSQMSEAGIARLLEIACPQITRVDGYKFSRVFASLEGNYGHLGRAWGSYLVGHRPEVQKTLIKVTDFLGQRIADPNGERRFQLVSAAQLYTGLVYFKQMTALPVDLPAFANMLETSITSPNDVPGPVRLDGTTVDGAERLINTFMADFRENLVITPTVRFHQPPQQPELAQLNEALRGKIVGHVSLADKQAWLSIEDIKRWAEKRGVSGSALLSTLKNNPPSAWRGWDTVGLGFNTRGIHAHVTGVVVVDLTDLGH